MASVGYFGEYTRFTALDKDEAGVLLGPDNIVGDFYTFEDIYTNGERQTWIVNPFGFKVGAIPDSFAEKLDFCDAKGWKTVAMLSFVAFTQEPTPGTYWGELAVIAYDPEYEEAFTNFINKVHSKIASGIRPDLKLGQNALNTILNKNGDYFPTGRTPFPTLQKGEAFVKKERSSTEFLVNQARQGNKGCYFISYAVIICVIILIIYLIANSGILNGFFG